MPGRGRLQDGGGGAAAAAPSTNEASAPVAATASATRVEDRDALDVLPPLPGVIAGHHLGAVGPVAQAVEPALARRSGPGRRPWCSRRRRCSRLSPRSLSRRGQGDGPAGGVEHGGLGHQAVGQVRGQDRPARLGVGAVEAEHDGRA